MIPSTVAVTVRKLKFFRIRIQKVYVTGVVKFRVVFGFGHLKISKPNTFYLLDTNMSPNH